MRRWIPSLLWMSFFPMAVAADEPAAIPLWEKGAPGSEGKTAPERIVKTDIGSLKAYSIHNPSITPYLPAKDKATGAAVLLYPGGGHRELNVSSEGYDVAKWLAERGVAAFVVKYRLARERGSTYKMDVHAFADTRRAIRLVRSKAEEWGIDPKRVGAVGFSAGGELVTLACQRAAEKTPEPTDEIDALDAKPSFQGLLYPGATFRIQPDKDSPPAFLAVGSEDGTSVGLAQAYSRFRTAGVPVEFHVFAGAGHPTGFRPKDNNPAAKWPDRFSEWMADQKILVRP